MKDPDERLKVLAGATRAGALANLREDVRARLNAGTPRALADMLFDLLEAALAKEAPVANNTYVSGRLSRSSAAEKLNLAVESGTFKNAVKRVEEVLGACRPDDSSLMPPDEDRSGVACIEAVIGDELWLLIVRGPTGEVRGGETESPPLLRLVAEYRRLDRYKRADFHWNLRQTRNFTFTGREALFEALDAAAERDVTPRIDILVGLGGVGKSHVCVEYAYRQRPNFDVIWWIRATDTTTIEEDLRSLAVDLLIADDQVPTPEAVSRIRAWLERNSRWLLIIDNADSPDAIQPYVPAGGSGRILVTSLNPAWQPVGRVHDVPDFPEPDAIRFLTRRSGFEDENAGALARQLGCLPLALEHAAAYIDATGVTNAEYLAGC
jgi:hypothetical protein